MPSSAVELITTLLFPTRLSPQTGVKIRPCDVTAMLIVMETFFFVFLLFNFMFLYQFFCLNVSCLTFSVSQMHVDPLDTHNL